MQKQVIGIVGFFYKKNYSKERVEMKQTINPMQHGMGYPPHWYKYRYASVPSYVL